jgi:hypothetical protein
MIMPVPVQSIRWWLIGTCAVVAALIVAGVYFGPKFLRAGPSSNAILIIAPYRFQGTWVFDDPTAGLTREPFVAGVPEMIDELVKEIPEADSGFRLYFSAHPFPGHQKSLHWLRGDGGGNWYRLDDPPMEGWICPAMFKYYQSAPTTLYVKAEQIKRS